MPALFCAVARREVRQASRTRTGAKGGGRFDQLTGRINVIGGFFSRIQMCQAGQGGTVTKEMRSEEDVKESETSLLSRAVPVVEK